MTIYFFNVNLNEWEYLRQSKKRSDLLTVIQVEEKGGGITVLPPKIDLITGEKVGLSLQAVNLI